MSRKRPERDAPRPLHQLAACLENGGTLEERDLAPYLASPDPVLRSAGYQLKSKNHYNLGLRRAQEAMETANVIEGFANQSLLLNLMKLCEHRHDAPARFRYLMRFAQAAAGRHDDALALEAMLQACALDFNTLGMHHCSQRAVVQELVEVYRAISRRQRQRVSWPQPRPLQRRQPWRLAHVVPNLVDDGNSPTKVVRNFVKHADRRQFDVRLYSSEVLTKRDKAYFALRMITPGTAQRAPKTLRFLQEQGCPVWLAPVDLDFVEAAYRLADQLYRDQVDVALYHSSLATSIDCLAAWLRPTPVCVNICLGLPMFADPTDAAVYFVEANCRREADYWQQLGAEAHYVQGGIDLDEVETAQPIDRAALGLPEGVVVLGTVGNHLATRMSPEFCRVVGERLRRHAQTLYFIVGGGDFQRQKALWQEMGVLGRVVFLGPRLDAPRFTKTFDIYLNEFPEGGGMSVAEAMAAGKPVVALRAGDQHLQCCGVEYVGPEYGIMTFDVERYAALADRLIADPDLRRRVGQAMRDRYTTVYAGRHLVARTEALLLDLLDRRCREPVPAVA